ncbi:coiled-coil domain-containing protein 137-like [Lineus longissimus]|uniref:coiled-coil domain-containing protein 137-like n=1 Tax=Lineus longissimus TaxID=88925 RepID=UPI002B4DC675
MGRPKASGKPMKSNRHRKLKVVDQEYADLWRSDGSVKAKGEKKGKPKNIRQADLGINQRPKASDEDTVPRSVKELMEGKLMAKKNKNKRAKKRKGPLPEHLRPMEKGMTRPVEPAPKFFRNRDESEWSFVNRVNNEVKTVIAKTQFEDKFGVNASIGKNGGVIVKPKKDTKTKLKAKQRSKEKKQKDKEKREMKKLSKKTGFEILKDEVKFGEVAMAPPNISKKPRGAPSLEMRPGKKNLLLKEIIHSVKTTEHESSAKVREIGKTIKRKNLSISEQRKLDAERERVVDLYRQLRAKKYSANAL